MCNFLAAGPSAAITETTLEYFGDSETDWYTHISKVAYLYTTTALTQGLGNLIWMPLIIKYGRRPIYLSSFTLYTGFALWAGFAKTYESALAARIFMGFAAGSGECLAPLTISDIFFLHERGAVMAIYTASLNFGVSIGIILSGLIILDNSWRYIYFIAAALIATLTIVVFFTMPETSFNRGRAPTVHHLDSNPTPGIETATKQQTCRASLALYTGKWTSESFLTLFLRPIIMLILPPVLWATLVMAVTIGFMVAISSNFATAYSKIYGFESWQSGLCFISGLIGSAFGIFFGGYVSDVVADLFTKKNEGIREPEFRLPAMAIGMLTSPLALCLYGAGMEMGWHWIVPTISIGLLNFSIAQATNVALVYVVDAYRPVAGETVVTQLAFKSGFGFLLSFYTNTWIERSGYCGAFGAMAAITAAVLSFWLPFFVYGRRVRHATMQWPMVARFVQWDEDREVGE